MRVAYYIVLIYSYFFIGALAVFLLGCIVWILNECKRCIFSEPEEELDQIRDPEVEGIMSDQLDTDDKRVELERLYEQRKREREN